MINNSEGASTFQLRFTLEKNSTLYTLFLVAGGAAIPLIRVVIVVTINGSPQVLIDGVMTHHEITPGSGKEAPVLTVTGEDLTKVMDYIDFSGFPFPCMPAEARVLVILAKYALFGVVPLVIPSVLIDIPIPVQQIPRQQGKDLAYVRALADEVGYVFYIDPGPAPGSSVAYWGPEVKVERAAAGAEHRHGRADQRGIAELSLRQRVSQAPHRLHPGADDQGDDPDPDPAGHPAESAAGRDPADPEGHRPHHRDRQVLADPGRR